MSVSSRTLRAGGQGEGGEDRRGLSWKADGVEERIVMRGHQGECTGDVCRLWLLLSNFALTSASPFCAFATDRFFHHAHIALMDTATTPPAWTLDTTEARGALREAIQACNERGLYSAARW